MPVTKGPKAQKAGAADTIRMIAVGDLKPYPNNPRNNRAAVRDVANSIRDFGFRQPVVVDVNHVIVAGHTRVEAAKKLGLKEVPCIVASDLSPRQVQAYRLADNKTAEKSEWEPEALNIELAELQLAEFDMSLYGFDGTDLAELFMEPGSDGEPGPDGGEEGDKKGAEGGGYFGDDVERTYNAYRLNEFRPERAEGYYQIPMMKACRFVPEGLIEFSAVKSAVEKGRAGEFANGVHFFIDDYRFERIWNEPKSNIELLKPFACTLTPDFSLYLDMPMAMKIWNVYRSRLIGQMMQDAGLEVIPTLQWAEEETFKFCFDGIEPGGVVAVSTVGVAKDRSGEAQDIWRAGMDAAIEILQPETVLCYGSRIEYDFGGRNVKYIAARKFGGR